MVKIKEGKDFANKCILTLLALFLVNLLLVKILPVSIKMYGILKFSTSVFGILALAAILALLLIMIDLDANEKSVF